MKAPESSPQTSPGFRQAYPTTITIFVPRFEGNPNALVGVMDVTLQSHVNAIYEKALQLFGTIDVIIANGGTRQRDLYLDTHGSVT